MILNNPDKLAPFSEKQKAVIYRTNKSVNIIEGGIRAAKSFSIRIRKFHYSQFEPVGGTNYPMLFLAYSIKAFRVNYLIELKKMYGDYCIYNNEGIGRLFGRPFVTVGYGKPEIAVKQIRGATYAMLYVFEASFCPFDIYKEAQGRLSPTGSQAFLDTNPENAFHWIYKEIQLAKKDKQNYFHISMTMEDNLSLSEEYKARIKRQYVPGTLLYKRKIEGLWVSGENLVFDCFIPDKHVVSANQIPGDEYFEINIIGIDPGTVAPFCFEKIGYYKGYFFIRDEFYYDPMAPGNNGKKKLNDEVVDDLSIFMHELRGHTNIYQDPEDADLSESIKRNLFWKIKKNSIKTGTFYFRNAYKNVKKNIETINALFSQNKIIISDKCEKLLFQISNYEWNYNKLIRTGVEEPKPGNDHAVDAFIYGICTFLETLLSPEELDELRNYTEKITYDTYSEIYN